jgi:hypothetical protein
VTVYRILSALALAVVAAGVARTLVHLQQIGATVATQDDVTALASRIDAVSSAVATGVANIRQDIEDIKSANPEVDLSALEASVAGLESSAGQLTDLDAENPAAPGEPVPGEPGQL